VILNADLIYSYNELLPRSRYANALKRRSTSCSSISFFWAFDEILPQLRAHNIFLAEEYRESFDSIFDDHTLPAEPSFYVNVPSRVDSTAAPGGKETVVVLVPIGHLTSNEAHYDAQAWKTVVSKTRDFVLNAIESRTGLKDLRSKIVFEKYETPLTWESKYNLDRGAILGLSHSFLNVLMFRPKNKHPSIGNLYFVGASTHPGTGVPVCLAGAKLVAEKVMKAYENRGSDGTVLRFGTLFAITSMLLALVSVIFSWADMNNRGKDMIFA
jgi:phytoene desaturase (3,4-didehydrolycopene-forming)